MSMDNGYDVVIENIKNILKKKGIKQNVVAERAGFTPQEFSNILNERRKLLRVEFVKPIADALEVEVNEIYGITDKTGAGRG